MASDNELLIKVSAQTDKAVKEISRLNKEVDKLTKETEKNKKSLKGQETALAGVSTSAGKLDKSLKSITLGLGAVGVALKGVEFANLAADAEQSADAFDKVFTDMGLNAEEEFNKIKEASMGLIPEAAIKQSAVTAASLGVPISKLAELMEVARAKSREMGTDAASAFADLATGIGRGSPMILDNLGLTIKLEAANQKWAESNNTTVKSMTKQQKQLALTNAVIEAGAKSVERYADAQLSSKEKMQQFNAKIDDLKVKIGGELLPALTGLAEATSEWVDSIDPQSIETFGDGVEGLFTTISKLVGIISDLNDLGMPDIFGGEDAGLIGTVAEGWGKLIDLFSKASDVLKNLSLSNELSDSTSQAIADTQELTNAISLLEIGAKESVNGFALQGEGLKKLREEYDKEAKALQDSLAENLKLQEFFRNDKSKERGAEQLAKLKEEQDSIMESSEQLGTTYKTVFGEDVPKAIEKSTEASVKLSKEQQDALEKLNKERVKDAEKTLKTLAKNEEKLTKDILSLNKKLDQDLKSIENDRLKNSVDLQTKIQELQRSGLGEKEAYYQKEKDADKLLSDAKRALIRGDLDAYKTYASAYKSLVESNGDKAITKNGAILVSADEVRKNSIENLKEVGALDSQYYDQKKTKAQEAHDQQVAFKQIEIDLVKLNIEAEKELITLAATPKGTPIDETALDAVLGKIEGLKAGLNSIQNTTANVNVDSAQIDVAKQRIEEIKTFTLNGVTLEVDADTTPADYGIGKLITKVGKDSIEMDVNPKYVEAQKQLDAFRNAEKKDNIKVGVDADTSKANAAIEKLKKPTKSQHKVTPNTSHAQSAIDKLKQPTFSTHTVYEKIVPARASGGHVPFAQKLATGGAFRGSGRVPGYDPTDSDKVNAVLTGGEFVIKRSAVDKIGLPHLNALNRIVNKSDVGSFKMPKIKGYASGGLVSGGSGTNVVAPSLRPININIGSETFPAFSEEKVAQALDSYFNTQGGM